ncbi:hypothetical protein SCA03_32650 [Streptomyces cacaoi]|uniref:Class E sortase n=1 Tax=Streptomyces cacaoi TaxID=1898 RepID=A0A4Y3QZ75_STRCI|nr:hypothetical protein SCA03_32650 [Streptomyces cacaoi]
MTKSRRGTGPEERGPEDATERAQEPEERPEAEPEPESAPEPVTASVQGDGEGAEAEPGSGAAEGAEAGSDLRPAEAAEAEPGPDAKGNEDGDEGKSEDARAGAGAEADAGARAGAGTRGRVAAVVGVVGELLITGGLVLGLFVVYSLWWTNVIADREARKESDRVREHWAAGDSGGPGALDTKDGIGFLHVPSMTSGEILVKKGTDPKELNQGIAGYYTKPVKSALPQDRSGNFSLAAHRDGHGARFHNIDKIHEGDPIVFETKNTWFVYKVYKTLPKTSKYNVDVLDPVPKESGKKTEGRYITLTTCTPVYTSRHRYIVWGELVRTQDVDSKRTPPAELR